MEGLDEGLDEGWKDLEEDDSHPPEFVLPLGGGFPLG